MKEQCPTRKKQRPKNRRCSPGPLDEYMNKTKESKSKIYWGFVLLGILLFIMGGMMIIQGIEANKTGAIIPQTGKTGPMMGMQSIVTGIVAGIAGTVFIGYEIYRIYKR